MANQFSQRNETFNKANHLSIQNEQPLLLPRASWQDQKALLKVLIRVKQSLDIAEITALLD